MSGALMTYSGHVFVIPGRGCPHSHIPSGSHALRLVNRTQSSVPCLWQGNPTLLPQHFKCLLHTLRHRGIFMWLILHSHQQNNPSNKINASSPVTKSHIKKFTFCCLALSLTVRWNVFTHTFFSVHATKKEWFHYLWMFDLKNRKCFKGLSE